MKKQAVAMFAFTALAISPSFAQGEFALLKPRESIDRLCGETAGVACVKSPDLAISQNMTARTGLGLSPTQLSFFDRASSPPTEVYGFLILQEARTPGGNSYYRATAKTFKTSFSGVGLREDEDYLPVFWSEIAQQFYAVPVGSSQEGDFITATDKKAALAAARAAEKARTEQLQRADVEYRASPEHAATEHQREIDQCKATIRQAERALAQDERVARISGYENKAVREQAAIAIVQCQDFLSNR